MNQLEALPRVVHDLVLKELESDLLIFRNYGKDVTSLTSDQSTLFRLCKSRATYETAFQSLGKEATFSLLVQLQHERLLEPSHLPKVNQAAYLSTQMGKETLVYHSVNGEAILLDPVTSYVWSLCDGIQTSAEVSEALAARFEVSRETAEELLWVSLVSLREKELILVALPAPMSRREFGLKWAAAVALFPTIAAVTAPVPSAANSAGCVVQNAGCVSALASNGGRVKTAVTCCTFNATPPCNPRGAPSGNSDVCAVIYNRTGSSCLNDSLGRGAICNQLPDRVVGFTAQTLSSQVQCSNARAASITLGFSNYECAVCP